jgi:hypothetical protein
MNSRKRPFLGLEALEDRWVPATIRFDGSNLTISNLMLRAGGTSSVTVTEAATGNNFTVLDGAASNGTYAVSGNITIQGNSAKDTIAVNVNPGTGLLGNLNVSTTGAASAITVDGTAANGKVLGNTQITLGSGGGTINLGTKFGLNDLGTLGLSASAFSNNTLNVGNATNVSSFAGTTWNITNFNNVTLGAGAADSFKGNVTVSDPNNGNAGTVTLGLTASVLGNFTINGGTGNETVNINGAGIGGTLSVHDQSGTNALNFGSGAATTIGGSLSYTALNGNTSFTASAVAGTALTIQNNANFNWGNGANSFGSSTGLTVNGPNGQSSLTVTNGTGGLDITTNTFRGVVNTLTINSGNGTNSVTLDGTNGAVVNTFNYGQNNGGNSVTVNDNNAGHLITLGVYFGTSGANLFTITPTTTAGLTGTISWATQTTANAGNGLVPTNYAFFVAINLINVPS